MDSDSDEIRTASDISPKNIDHPALRDWTTVGWLIAHDAKITRLSTPLQALYDITQLLQGDLEASAAEPPAKTGFRAAFQQMGRAVMDDGDRLTQDAVAGTILTILWKQIAHLANHIGLKPENLKYGAPVNRVPLTQVLYAIRGAEMHSNSWTYRDFKIEDAGRKQIRILKTAGITPIPFSAYAALRVVAPNGVSSLLLSLIPLMHEMVADALKATGRAKTRKTPAKPARKKATRRKIGSTKQAARKK